MKHFQNHITQCGKKSRIPILFKNMCCKLVTGNWKKKDMTQLPHTSSCVCLRTLKKNLLNAQPPAIKARSRATVAPKAGWPQSNWPVMSTSITNPWLSTKFVQQLIIFSVAKYTARVCPWVLSSSRLLFAGFLLQVLFEWRATRL